MMKERTLRVLEFTRIRELLAEGALTPAGAEKCRQLEPADELTAVQALQAETEEATVILQYAGGHPMIAFPDVKPALVICEKGGSLSAGMLLNVAELLRASRAAQDALVTERENTPLLRAKAEGLFVSRSIEKDITDAIISEDEIADRASSELMNIRRHLRGAQDRIRDKLNQMIHSATLQKALQDPIITVRNNRYVLPVKAEYRSMVQGLVHDQSSSGATLFIEPMAAVEMGNELKQWELKEQQEIARILAALSAEVAPYAAAIAETQEQLAELDFIFAKGLLSRRFFCVSPKMNNEGRLKIIRGRHPLIDPEKVVPSTIWLGEEFTSLIITGPNTGGKTVTLKTIGLLTLMAECGLHIPAADGSRLPVFSHILADIGDEQSIEQSLSTFSAHMSNIVRILEECDEKSLILFDELGAGTDPTEGAALAIAVIEHARRRGAVIAATTHYAELKVYATNEPGVQNASCEFDVETLQPTYRLLVGIPGKSNAFAISRRLGLGDEIIEDAKTRVSTESASFEATIEKLEQTRVLLEKDREEAEKKLREAQENAKKAAFLRAELEVRLDKADTKSRREAERILADARAPAQEVFPAPDEMRKRADQDEDASRVNEARAQLRRQLNLSQEALQKELHPEEENKVSARPVRPGDTVRIKSMGMKATVVSKSNDGTLSLRAGIMNVSAKEDEVLLLEDEAPKQKKAAVSAPAMHSASISPEIDLRGMESIDAVMACERYLDSAVMAKRKTVTVIHGKGTGALRAAVQQMLRKNKAVKSFRLGRYGEGESGVTVVELK